MINGKKRSEHFSKSSSGESSKDTGKYEKTAEKLSLYLELITYHNMGEVNRDERRFFVGYIEDLRAKVGHSPLILVGVAVLVFNEENELLLQQKLNGQWAIPGGLMELMETTEDTGRREMLEETGLQIGDMQLVGVFSGQEYYVKLDNGDELYPVTIAYLSRDIRGRNSSGGWSRGNPGQVFQA